MTPTQAVHCTTKNLACEYNTATFRDSQGKFCGTGGADGQMFRRKWKSSTSITVLASLKRVSERKDLLCLQTQSYPLGSGVTRPKNPRQVQSVTYTYSLQAEFRNGMGRWALPETAETFNVVLFGGKISTISSGQASVEPHISRRERPILMKARCVSSALQRGYHHPIPCLQKQQFPPGARPRAQRSSSRLDC